MRSATVIPSILLGLLLAGSAHAQSSDSTAVDPTACAPGTAQAYLDIGNVRAAILNTGNLFWSRGLSGYEVPKGSGVSAVFSASLLVTALVDGQLRATTGQYVPHEFWPGPYGTTDCTSADRIWEFRPDTPLPDGWPEDRPRPEQFGHQMLWWTMNDTAGPHEFSDTTGVGLEVEAAAFAFDVSGAVGNSTFYSYRVRNVSPDTLRDMHIGLFVDADLGSGFDDYVGSDSSLGMGYFYNADDNDEYAYGVAPPAVGSLILKRPESTIYTDDASCRYPDDQPFGYTNHTMINKGGGRLGYGKNGLEYHYSMRSRDRNGNPLYEGADLFHMDQTASGRTPARFLLAGDPVTRSYFSFMNADGEGNPRSPHDVRSVGSAGPVCLGPGHETEVVFAIVWSRGEDHLDSVAQLRRDAAHLIASRHAFLSPLPLEELDESFVEYPFAASVYPNPAGPDGATARFSTPEPLDVSVTVFNVLGQRVFVAAEVGVVTAGDYSWTLPTATWPASVYLVRITAGHTVTTRRLVVSGTH